MCLFIPIQSTIPEELIRRRLLFDGDGNGDEKRISTITRTIIKWSEMECSDEERNTFYQKIIMLLKQCEYSMTKHHLAYLMNIEERKNYEQLYQDIKQQIADVRKEITECKEELKQAKIIRKNRQEYDSLAKVIERFPERKASEQEIKDLQTEISDLSLKKQSLIQKLEMRQKQFHVLLYSVQLLQQILDDDEDTGAVSTTDQKKTKSSRPGVVEVMDIS